MIYVVYFADEGTSKMGLSPILDIFVKVSDGTSAGTPPEVNELSGGVYKFSFVPTEEVAIRVDSGDATMNDADRFIPLVAGPHDDDIDATISSRSTHSDVKTTVTTRPIYQTVGTAWSVEEKEKIIKKINKIDLKLQKSDTKELEVDISKFKKLLLELLNLANTKIFKSIEEIKKSDVKERTIHLKALSLIKNEINNLNASIDKVNKREEIEELNSKIEDMLKILSKTLSNKELEDIVNEF